MQWMGQEVASVILSWLCGPVMTDATCSNYLGLRKPRPGPPRHPFCIANPPITPAHALDRDPILTSIRTASWLCHSTPLTDHHRHRHTQTLGQLHDQLRTTDAKHANMALMHRLPSYDDDFTPSAKSFSIRRVKHAPLPLHLHVNSSIDKAVYILGDLTTDPLSLATAWNECLSSMGHTLIGHPYNTRDSPFTMTRLLKMTQRLPPGKSPGPSGITYTIVKKGGIPWKSR